MKADGCTVLGCIGNPALLAAAYSYDLYNYGYIVYDLYSYGLRSWRWLIIMAYMVMADICMACILGGVL